MGDFGKDVLTGDEERDRFAYTSAKDFDDRITDFELIKDNIDLKRVKGINSMDDLNFIQKGDDAIIQVQVGSKFKTVSILDNIDIHDLANNHFNL